MVTNSLRQNHVIDDLSQTGFKIGSPFRFTRPRNWHQVISSPKKGLDVPTRARTGADMFRWQIFITLAGSDKSTLSATYLVPYSHPKGSFSRTSREQGCYLGRRCTCFYKCNVVISFLTTVSDGFGEDYHMCLTYCSNLGLC